VPSQYRIANVRSAGGPNSSAATRRAARRCAPSAADAAPIDELEDELMVAGGPRNRAWAPGPWGNWRVMRPPPYGLFGPSTTGPLDWRSAGSPDRRAQTSLPR